MTRRPIDRIADSLRPLGSALATTARQISTRRLAWTGLAVAAMVAVALLVRLPSAIQLRDWSTSMGPWLPLAFLGAHIVVTVLPFPRTAFTLAAGLLFGPALGIGLAVVASTVSALIALGLVRAAGWQLSRLVRHAAVDRVDARLRERGWLAVLSLRLVPVVPFAPLNYAAGASGVRVLPYTLATVAGLVPGTSAVVILGDALTGHVSPLLVLISACTGLVGLALFGYEIRRYRTHHHAAQTDPDDAAAPAAFRR
ncbi:TVP38/TMEM64 family protein [Candidatus Mycobacterium wuenschmannii]|uniref:TVP38/TMEM64 family membrane protein n=1 Tax=Candidatus Mycobacterium wuenschmannii TaxID=3027808 RepID=A0ABY8VYI9_9MYCO|nr:TVP38/TMEM64 family protein [Candidatus Mycobacterium wuenschmannii]WIM88699.1 TVP38/TMEM64 family protein [Candidatus Mycobacterium wuenschmannii]